MIVELDEKAFGGPGLVAHPIFFAQKEKFGRTSGWQDKVQKRMT